MTDKATLRRVAFDQRRAAFDSVDQTSAADALLAHVLSFERHGVVAGYMPIRTEIDPLPVMIQLVARGCRVGVPVIDGPDQPLRFVEWSPDAEMTAGPFGARIPVAGDELEPEVVITPLVGFDARGYRLGYGGGYYDRTFPRLQERGGGVAVGFAFADQELPDLPVEPTDVRLHSLVTERGVRSFD